MDPTATRQCLTSGSLAKKFFLFLLPAHRTRGKGVRLVLGHSLRSERLLAPVTYRYVSELRRGFRFERRKVLLVLVLGFGIWVSCMEIQGLGSKV